MKKLAAYFALLIAAALTASGLFAGQYAAVLAKAARVCLECVGIG